MFKVNNKDTGTTSLVTLPANIEINYWCLVSAIKLRYSFSLIPNKHGKCFIEKLRGKRIKGKRI